MSEVGTNDLVLLNYYLNVAMLGSSTRWHINLSIYYKMPQTNLTKARARAKALGVQVKPSTTKYKKLDVFDVTGKTKIASIGDLRYSDFLQHGDEMRRKRYKARHEPFRHKKGTPSYYADQILWS